MRWQVDQGTSVKRKRHRKLFYYTLFLFIGTILWTHATLLSLIGKFLVVDDFSGRADVGIVLAGEYPNRLMEGAKLLTELQIDHLLLAKQIPSNGEFVLAKWGIDGFQRTAITQRLLNELGAPGHKVSYLPMVSASTSQEAKATKTWISRLKNRAPKSIVVISSATHTRRARSIFRKHVGDKVKVMAKPSRFDNFDPTTWWKSRRFLKEVVLEYEKMLARVVLD